MTSQAVIIFVLLAAIVVPVVMAEVGRRKTRSPATKPRPVKREAADRPPLRLVVNKNDMDRELAALLAKDSRKSTEREE